MNKNLYLLSAIFLIFTGCAQLRYVNENATKEQEKQDHLDCKFESSKVGGYDYIDKALNRREAFDSCLEAKGYIKKRIQ